MNRKSTMHGYVNPRTIFVEHQEIGPANMISWTGHSNNDSKQYLGSIELDKLGMSCILVRRDVLHSQNNGIKQKS